MLGAHLAATTKALSASRPAFIIQLLLTAVQGRHSLQAWLEQSPSVLISNIVIRFASSGSLSLELASLDFRETIISIKVNCCFKGVVPPKVLALLLRPSKVWNNARLQEIGEQSAHGDPGLGETLSTAMWTDSLGRVFIFQTQNGHRARKPMQSHEILRNHFPFLQRNTQQTTGEGTFSSREGVLAQQALLDPVPATFQYETLTGTTNQNYCSTWYLHF